MSKPSARVRNRDGATSLDVPKSRRKDVVLIHSRTDDGVGLNVVRVREDKVELGSVRPLKEGQPISGEVVQLTPRPECPILCDVESQYRPPAEHDVLVKTVEAPNERATEQAGPPQVATDRYRQNWDAIWSGRSTSRKSLLN